MAAGSEEGSSESIYSMSLADTLDDEARRTHSTDIAGADFINLENMEETRGVNS